MAPRIIPEHGFDPSCGDFGVSVVQKQTDLTDSAFIQVQYDEWIDLNHTFYSAETPWEGGEISVDDIEKLLNSAKVPPFIQQVSAIGMILRCVNGTLEEIKGDSILGLPSILVKIDSDKETFEWDDFDQD